jgi:integrase
MSAAFGTVLHLRPVVIDSSISAHAEPLRPAGAAMSASSVPNPARTPVAASVRARVAPGQMGRRCIPVVGRTDAERAERSRLVEQLADDLRGTAPVETIVELLKTVGRAKTPRALSEALKAVRAVADGETDSLAVAALPTFADFAEEWTDKTLHKRFPDHVPDKDEAEDKQILRDYVNPRFGGKRLTEIGLEDAEAVMQALPPTLAPRTRRHIAQCMRKVLSLAVYPGRHIQANPIPREWMPKIPKSANKAKSCLFPDEDVKLLGCVAVPLDRRIAYGILMREGMRASELSELRWSDVDLTRGRVRLDENKTDDPRAWALSPDVVRVLSWWKERTGADDSDRVLCGLDLTQGPRWLRGKVWDPKTRHKNELGDLRAAGVDRAELFERTKSRMPIRLHDMRSTFVTVSLANGKTEQWVTDRTGHKSSQMIALYKRQARQWSELELGAMQPMDSLLPEMGEGSMEVEVPSQGPSNNTGGGGPELQMGDAYMCYPGSERAAISSDCWTRTSDPAVNSRLLYQLS